jgi:hypothetical protein
MRHFPNDAWSSNLLSRPRAYASSSRLSFISTKLFADFITPIEAEAATQANVYAIVVDRPGNAPLSDESKAKFHVIHELTDLP